MRKQMCANKSSVSGPLPSEQQGRGGPDNDGRRSGRQHCTSGPSSMMVEDDMPALAAAVAAPI